MRWSRAGRVALATALLTACGYSSEPAGPGDPGDVANLWQIDDTRFGASDAFLGCRDAQSFDRDRDSVVALTAGDRWLVGDSATFSISTAARLASDEVTLTVSRGAVTFVAQSGAVSARSASADEPWPFHVVFADVPGLDLQDTEARLSGDLQFDVTTCP